MSTFLITGARGQDGRITSEQLSARGHEVVAVSHVVIKNDENKRNFVSYDWDWKDAFRFCEIVEETKPDYIINYAAYHHSSQTDFRDLSNHSKMIDINISGLSHIIQSILSISKDIGLIHCSSSQIYTAKKVADWVDESRSPMPSTIYGVAKYSGMELINYYKEYHGLRAGSMIYFNHESEYRSPDFLTRLISRQVAKVKTGTADSLHLKNIGAAGDFSSARDVVEATIDVCLKDAFDTYIVSSGIGTSVSELVKFAFESVDLDWEPNTTFDRNEAIPYLIGTNGKIKSRLGWQPSYSMRDVISGMVEFDLSLLNTYN